MYPVGSATSFQGKISTPMMPVIYPPILNEMLPGERFAKSFAGLTMLAAMFVASVEMATATIANVTNILLSNLAASTNGSHIVVPYIIVVADVTTTPMNANNVIA